MVKINLKYIPRKFYDLRGITELPKVSTITRSSGEIREKYQFSDGSVMILCIDGNKVKIEKGIHTRNIEILKDKVAGNDRWFVPYLFLDEIKDSIRKEGRIYPDYQNWAIPQLNPHFYYA